MNKYKLLSATVLTLLATAALGGLVQPKAVLIIVDEFNNGFADGNQLTARASDNEIEFIGCGTRIFDDGVGGSFKFGFCQAGDAEDNQVTCFTENETLLDAMKANNAYSYITFSFQDDGFGGLECVRVGMSANSFYLPDLRQENKVKRN